jgi:hypothetical protein
MALAESGTSASNATTLNLVFHGAFVYLIGDNGVEVLTPNTEDHAHYAGSWKEGGLRKLKRDMTYQLTGVKSAANKPVFDPNQNVTIQADLAANPTPATVHSRWMLPFPKQLTTLQRITKFDQNVQPPRGAPQVPGTSEFAGNVNGKPYSVTFPRQLGTVQVFTFELDGSPLGVSSLPEWVPDTGGPSVNLHVYAEETHRWTPQKALQHPGKEFEALIGLFDFKGAVPPGFSYIPDEIPLVEPNTQLPKGLRQIELVCLVVSGLVPYNSDPKAGLGEDGDTIGHPCLGANGGH